MLPRPSPPPRFITPYDRRAYATHGPAISATATLLGQPPIPWQELTADVLGAVHPDGRFVFPFIVITVPRQAGKTTIVLAKDVHRALYQPGRRIWYTAQTGKYARDKWGEMVDVIDGSKSPLRPVIRKIKRTNGDESLQFVNGSTLNPHPPTRDGLHSKQSDSNDIDEAWKHDMLAGAELMGAITPTQTTRPQRQTVVLSTMGDARSEWLHDLVDKGSGRGKYAAAGPDPSVFVIDYGAPDGTDPDDLDTIARWHPGYGYLCDRQALEDARAQLGAAEFLRAYGNLRSGAASRVIPEPEWIAAATGETLPHKPAGFGVAVSEDLTETAIYAGFVVDGDVVVELVALGAGTAWAVDKLDDLTHDAHGQLIAADPGGPAGPIVDELRRRITKRRKTAAGRETRDPVQTLTRADYAAACSDMVQRVTDADGPRWRWRPEDVDRFGTLSRAVEATNKLTIGDGAFVWGRKASHGSIAALEAATLAGRAALHAPKPRPRPKLV